MHDLRKKYLEKIALPFFVIGIFLFLVNITGLLIPLKNPDIYKEKTSFKDDITLSTKEALSIINQPTANTEQYVRNVTYAINKGILHYWSGKNDKKYNVILPFYENYILFILTHTLFRQSALKYEFCNYKKTIARGVGWCSQESTALADLLNKKHIPTNIISWPQHVVTEIQITNNKRWVVDPDYGVIIEHSINDIAKDPSILIPVYKHAGYSNKEIKRLMTIFNSSNINQRTIYKHNGPGYANCNGIRKLIEDLSYIFIWIIPTFLIVPFTWINLKKKYVKKQSK